MAPKWQAPGIHGSSPPFPNRIFIGRENIPHAKDRTTRYMEAVVARLQADPARCIMIGDKVEIDLIPAQAVGMQTVLMKNERYPGTWAPQIERLSELVPLVRKLESQPA
jgi:predicted HAD superfamily phosphohydrolase YqeG